MPVYEYQCKNCGQRFEKIQPVTADPLTECEICGQGPIRRVLHPVGVIFKGSGWYVTDNRNSSKGSNSSASKTGDDSKAATSSSETPKADTSSSTSSGASAGTTSSSSSED